MRWAGALLLLAACGGTGLRCSRELRARVQRRVELLSAVDRLRTEVCCLQTPLTEVLRLLTAAPVTAEALRERPFAEIWCRELSRLGLDKEERRILERLGRALSRGDEPEGAFEAAREQLRHCRDAAREEAENKCRLCTALGLCTGVLLVIVLI